MVDEFETLLKRSLSDSAQVIRTNEVLDSDTQQRNKVNKVEFRRYPDQAHAFVEDLACIKRGGDAGK